MINRSFQLIRTNPLLTTNFKVVVSSDYSLYLESFNTNAELNNVKYKHYAMYKSELLENKIPSFYNKLPVELAFDIRYDNDNNVIQTDFQNQFDTTYYAGAGYVEDQWHSEEFDYLAPLYIRKNSLPKAFIILRVDEPSGYNLNSSNFFELNNLNKDNFHDIPDNWKCVKFFDMTYSSNLGEWLYKNYLNNDRFPTMSFNYNAEKAEFSNWYGMDYTTGIYTNRPLFMEDRNVIETPHFRFEKFITEGYKRSNLIYPYILNLKFLFDDTPATPTALRKYSMNRYYGFYADDIEYVGSITSYKTPEMRTDTYLINNIILTGSTGTTIDFCNIDVVYDVPSVNPFIEKWDDTKEYYVFIDNTNDFYRTKTISGLYPIKRVVQEGISIFKVISDDTMDTYWNPLYSNIKTVNINYTNFNILSGMTDNFFIDKYINCDQNSGYTYGDLYLIDIDGRYHVIKYSSGLTYSTTDIHNKNELITDPVTGDINCPNCYKYYIQSDYGINLNSDYIEYWIVGKNSEYYRKYNIIDSGVRQPLTFPIYRVKFSDIKDFDFDRVNTNYSDFDYEKTEYVSTPEEKLYAFDYNDNSIPPRKRINKIGTSSQYEISNISSEYIADDELYEVYSIGQQSSITTESGGENRIYDLSDIWRKNQSVVKWGFMGSISHSDYPYKLNNNYEVGGTYNRSVDPFSINPNVNYKNMDYFYRIGNFYNSTNDPTNYVYYKNQTTNIQYDFISTLIGDGFDLNAYFGNGNKIKFDYFTYFFKNKMYYEDKSVLYTKVYDKYSTFNCGDQYNPSVTLFKGLKIKIKEVKNIYLNPSTPKISKILYGNKTYNNYKCSIILNENYLNSNSGVINNNYLDTQTNSVNIILNEKYQNLLIIINANMSGNTFINDISRYDEKDGLYYGKSKDGTLMTNYNSSLFTASNFINAINDYNNNYGLTINYYLIREVNDYLYNGFTNVIYDNNSTMDIIPDWSYKFQPYMISIELPTSITINNNCYSTIPYYVNNVNDDYVATMINFDDSKSFQLPIYRFSGPYEPIFKDINIFKNSYFCYNYTDTGYTTTIQSNQSVSSLAYSSSGNYFQWSQLENICSSDNKYIQVNVPPFSSGQTEYLYAYGFNFNIPGDATISGITVTISRKSFVTPNDTLYVKDKEVMLTKNVFSGTYSPINQADSLSPKFDYWDTTLVTKTYPPNDEYNLWGDNINWSGSTLKGSDINSQYFGVLININVCNISGVTSNIIPQIKCVGVKINYKYNEIIYTGTSTVYFDGNYKFDTSLNDFGKIDEFIFSKVNDQVNIFKNSPNTYHIYPTIDEFGYEYYDRFIFKSPWDKEFFIKTTDKSVDVISGFQQTYIPFSPPIPIDAIPIVSTIIPTDISNTSADTGGNVISNQGSIVTEKGVCWSTSSNPTILDSHIIDISGLDPYSIIVTGLIPAETYYICAYATNSVGTGYGSVLSFTTLNVATHGTVKGVVYNSIDLAPISGAIVTITNGLEIIPPTTSDIDGNYIFVNNVPEDLIGNNNIILCEAVGYLDFTEPLGPITAGTTYPEDIQMDPL